MSEAERLLELLDQAIDAARNAYYAHSLKTKDLKALRVVIAECIDEAIPPEVENERLQCAAASGVGDRGAAD